MTRTPLSSLAAGCLALGLLAQPAQAQIRYSINTPFGGGYYWPSTGSYSGWYGSPYAYGTYYSPYYGGVYSPYTYGTWYNSYPTYGNVYYTYPGYASSYGTTYWNPPVVGNTYYSAPVTYSMATAQAQPGSSANYQSYYSGPNNVDADKARVRVYLPTADAQLVVEGQAMTTTGTDRSFVSPSLQPGANYAYTLRATWKDGDREVSQGKQITVRAGQETVVRFTNQGGASSS